MVKRTGGGVREKARGREIRKREQGELEHKEHRTASQRKSMRCGRVAGEKYHYVL